MAPKGLRTNGKLLAFIRVSSLSPNICERKVTDEEDTDERVSCYAMRDSLGCSQIIDI